MKLTSLINIKLSFNSDKLTICWKTEEELLKHITDLVSSFEDSDESITDPKPIVNHILGLGDRIKYYEYNKESVEKDLSFLKRCSEQMEPVEYSRIEGVVTKKIQKEKDKNGDPYVELTKEELYDILSLQVHRDRQLNKLNNGN